MHYKKGYPEKWHFLETLLFTGFKDGFAEDKLEPFTSTSLVRGGIHPFPFP